MLAPETGGIPSSEDPLVSSKRLASLAATRLLDTKAEEAFDRLTRLASNVLGVPIAAVTLLDATRQFIKSGVGLDLENEAVKNAPVQDSFCQHAVRARKPFIVQDSRLEPLVKESPFVAGGIISYAGVPISNGGEALGAFCIADEKPRVWTDKELAILKDLSAAVESQIAAHVMAIEAERRRELLETVIDTMGAGVMVCDADRHIQVVNAEARRLHGDMALAGSPVSERPARLGLYRADGKTHLELPDLPLTRAANGERIADFEMVIRPPNMPGTVTSVSVNARPLPTGGAVLIMHDRTSERELERKARTNEALLLRLAGNIPNALVYMLDRDMTIVLAQGRLFDSIGIEPEKSIGRPLLEFVHPENRGHTTANVRASLAGASTYWTSQRGSKTFEAHCQPMYEGGNISGVIVLYFDISERTREHDALRVTTARLEALLEHMSEGVIFEDADFHIQVVNKAGLELFGVKDAREMIGVDLTAPASISAPAARNSFAQPALASLEIEQMRDRGERVLGDRIELADGRIIERDFLPVVGPDGQHRGNLWMHRDVTERVVNQQKIEEMSVRDELTGLYNRRGFLARGQRCLDNATRGRKTPILFFVDLNGMKPINDQMGHEEGDRALVDTARLLEKAFGPGELVARLGGDEFVVLVSDPEHKPPAAFERSLRDVVTQFNDACKRLYRVSVSIGATEFDPEEPQTIEQLLNSADAQMYAAKRARQARGGVSIPPSRA